MKKLLNAVLLLALAAAAASAESKGSPLPPPDFDALFTASLSQGMHEEVVQPQMTQLKHDRYLFCRVYPPKNASDKYPTNLRITADIISDSELANVLITQVKKMGEKVKITYMADVPLNQAPVSTVIGVDDKQAMLTYSITFPEGTALQNGPLGQLYGTVSLHPYGGGGSPIMSGQKAYCYVKKSK